MKVKAIHQYPITTQYSEMMQYPIATQYSEMMQYLITTQCSEMMQYPIATECSEIMQFQCLGFPILTQDRCFTGLLCVYCHFQQFYILATESVGEDSSESYAY
jgi:hypothetical protein